MPNAGFLRYEPGAGFPLHKHDFAQVWYIIEGEFQMGDRTYGPGTLVYMEDPHYENTAQRNRGARIRRRSCNTPARPPARGRSTMGG